MAAASSAPRPLSSSLKTGLVCGGCESSDMPRNALDQCFPPNASTGYLKTGAGAPAASVNPSKRYTSDSAAWLHMTSQKKIRSIVNARGNYAGTT